MSILLGLVAVAAAQPTTATPATPSSDKQICKRVEENFTGSRLGKAKKVCRTASEWRQMDAETARAINKTKSLGLAEPFAHDSQGR